MRIAIGAGIALLAIVLLVVVVGWSLPVKHQASREATFSQPPDAIYAIITDAKRFPSWRKSVERVEPLASEGGKRRYREVGSDGAILYEAEEESRPTRMVTRIADPTLPFGGRWTYELRAVPGGTTLRITEDGEVYNPVFRFMSRYVFGHYRTMDTYLGDLAARVRAGG